jgi:hypothetical protein
MPKSVRLPSGATYFAHEHNALRSDAAAAAFLHAHQQLGALALGTNATNTKTLTLDINGTNVVLTFVTSIGATAGNVLIGASAAATVANLLTLLQNPTVTTSTGVALSSANAILVQYLGWALPSGGTTVTPFSLNTSTYAPLTSFSASTTVTSGTWTAQTMQLYVEPGTYFIAGTRYFFLGGSTPTVTAPVSHPRIDVLTINSSGVLAWTTGTENASPVAPAYPTGKVPLCELYNVVGETALYDVDNQQAGQGYISNDVRQILSNPYGQFILDPGSEVQGNVLYYNGASWVLLAPGTSGYMLQTQGASANPQWALNSTTHVVKDYSQPSATINLAATFQTIATYSSIPALTAGQSILLRVAVNINDSNTNQDKQVRVQMNGTTILSVDSGTNTNNGVLLIDLMIGVPTPASVQYATGYYTVVGGAPAMAAASIAANISSAFSMTVQGYLQNGNSNSGTFTIKALEMYVLN